MASLDAMLPNSVGGDYLNYSKGSTADTSAAQATEGLTGLFSMAVKGVDATINSYLQDEIYKSVDRAQRLAGVDAAAGVVSASDEVPVDVVRGGESLVNLKKARDMGAMNDTQYWARLTADTKRLRAQFPGYREEIDKYASAATGSIPANALRKALEQQTTDADPEAKRRLQLEDKLRGDNPELLKQILDYEKASGKKMDNTEFQYRYTSGEVDKYRRNQAKEDLEFKVKAGNAVDADIDRAASTQLAHVAKGHARKFDPLLQDLYSKATSTGTLENMSPTDHAGLLNNIRTAGLDLEAQQNEVFNQVIDPKTGETLGSRLGPKRVQELKATGKGNFQALVDAVGAKDTSALQVYAQINSYKTDVATAAIYQNQPLLLQMGAIKKIGGDQVGAAFFGAYNEQIAKGALDPNLTKLKFGVADVASGRDFSKTIADLKKIEEQTGERGPIVGRVITDIAKTGSLPDLDPKAMPSVAKSLFSGGQKNWAADSSIPIEDRQRFYADLTNPAFAANMAKAGPNSEHYKQYREWVSVNAVELGRNAAEKAAAIKFSNTDFTVVYNPKTYQLEAAARTNYEGRNPLDPLFNNSKATIDSNVRQINTMTGAIVNVARAAGMNEQQTNTLVLRTLINSGFDPGAKDSPGAVSTFATGVGNALRGYVSKLEDQRVPEPLRGLGVSINPALLVPGMGDSLNAAEPKAVQDLGAMFKDMPPNIRSAISIGSAGRSKGYQQELIDSGNPRAASPDRSRHVTTRDAFDIVAPKGMDRDDPRYLNALQWMYDNAPRYGFENPEKIRSWDRNHFQWTADRRAKHLSGEK